MAVDVSASRVPAVTVTRSTSVGSLDAMSVKDRALTQRGEKSALTRWVSRSLTAVPRAAAAKMVREEEGRSRAMIAVMAVRACSASSSSPPVAFQDRIDAMSPCWARVRAPVPSVVVSPLDGSMLTRAKEVKGTSSAGARAEAGAIVSWSADARLASSAVPKVASAGQATSRRIVGPSSGVVVVAPLWPVPAGAGAALGDGESGE